ncbi:MAG TPA: SRPBCC family protein [Gemmatimonadales bacterium]|nr:SRPBCC family protein [Gemmatimonadales bacterium]
MRTVDQIAIQAPLARVFEAASDIERWPAILSHYRWVRFLDRRAGGGTVEMAAWRPFGPLRWPAWWVSEMTVDPRASEIRYRHVRGITKGMDVVWQIARRGTEGADAEVTVIHEWRGPAWPLVGPLAADLVIGPIFIHGIASRTLAGIKRFAEDSRGQLGGSG